MIFTVSNQDTKRVVIVFATWTYRKILKNWVTIAPRSVSKNLVIYAYGLFYPTVLRLLGHNVMWISIRTPTRSKIWRDRVKAISNQLHNSAEVVVIDADALVLSDFTNEIDQIEGDVVISQGVGHPQSSFYAWSGFTLCCGFAVYRATEKTKRFMTKVAAFSGATGYDDQLSVNQVFLDNNLVWEQTSAQYFIQDEKRRIRCFPEGLVGTIPEGDLSGLKVFLLPHASYRRMPNNLENINPKVFHPLPKVQGAKGVTQSLKENGLWRL